MPYGRIHERGHPGRGYRCGALGAGKRRVPRSERGDRPVPGGRRLGSVRIGPSDGTVRYQRLAAHAVPRRARQRLDLGDGVRLEKLDEAIQLARARDSNPVGAVPLVVAGAATHAVVITGVTIDNSSLADRMWRGSAPSLPFAELDLAVECLRVVTRAPTGYAQVFLHPAGWADQWTHALPPVVDVGCSTDTRRPSTTTGG